MTDSKNYVNSTPTPGYDIKIDIDLSIPEEVRCHPAVQKWVENMELNLSHIINKMTDYYTKTGHMVVPVAFTPTSIKRDSDFCQCGQVKHVGFDECADCKEGDDGGE